MIEPTAPIDQNLKLAGYLLLFEFACFVVASMILERNGFSGYLALPVVWLFNLVVAWHLSKAATDLGKNKWLYGLMAALGPPLAIFAFSMLNLRASMHRLNHGLAFARESSISANPRSIWPWVYLVASGYLFGAIVSAFLAFLGVTQFHGDHRSEHIAFTTIFLGVLCSLIGYSAFLRLSKRGVHPFKTIVVFVLGAAFAILLLTLLYTRHVT